MPLARMSLFLPAVITLTSPGLAAAPAWEDVPAFSLTPVELQGLFTKIPIQARYPVQELLEDFQTSLDEAGRRSTRYRYIFRIDRDSAIANWGKVQASYTTWLDDKPTIKARVITPDGKEHFLDPTSIGEFSPEQEGSEMFTDQRNLKAPLPQLVPGAIAEVEIQYHNHRPFSRAGSRGSHWFAEPVPVFHSRYRLDAPASAALKWRLVGLSEQQLISRSHNGRTLLSLDLGPSVPRPKPEPHQAPDQDPAPAIHFSTTPSWQAAADEYAELVEAQLKESSLQVWVKEAVAGATERMEILKRLVARLHKEVRYTGLEFGDAALVPRPPAETLKRGYGDCKDKSALLVAILREAGIPAHIALLQVGDQNQPHPDLPGLSSFNHAIVYLPGPPALWIDPTVPEAPVGELPSPDLDHKALIIGTQSSTLVTIPDTNSERNVDREIKEVFLAENGPGRIVETNEAQGPSEVALRGHYLRVDPKQVREHLKNYAVETYKAKELGKLDYAGADDMNRPFRMVLEAQNTGIAATSNIDAAVAMNAWPLVNGLATALKAAPAEASDEPAGSGAEPKKADAEVPRKTDLLLWAPYAMEARWLIHPPTGYVQDSLPPDQTVPIGPAKLTMTFLSKTDGTVEAQYRLDCPQRRWTPKQVDEARAALKAFGETKIPVLVFQQVGEAFLGAGQTKEAVAEFRKEHAAAPNRPEPLVRLARAQFAAGLVDTAQESLKQALQLDPSASATYQVQGWVLQHDWVGRQFKPGWDRKGAVAAYRQALARDPKNSFAKQNLAILLEFNGEGVRYGRGADLEEAARLYKELIQAEKTDAMQDNLMVCLAQLGRLAEAQEVARAREASPRRNAWMVAMEACLNGEAKAKTLGRTLMPDLAARRAAYLAAADVAVVFRKYPEASALLNEGATGSAEMTQIKARAEFLAKVRRHENIKLDFKDPRDLGKAIVLLLGQPAITLDSLKPLLSEAVLNDHQVEKANKEQRKFATSVAKDGLPLPVMLDISMSLSDFTYDGDDSKGYEVKVEMQGQAPASYYAARTGDTYKLVGDQFIDLAQQALWHLKRGELAQARTWLDRVLAESIVPKADDPLSGHLLHRLWSKGQQGSAEEIRLAAMCILAMDPDQDNQGAYAAVRAALTSKLPQPQMSAVAQSARIAADEHKDWPTMDLASARELELFPESTIAQEDRINYLVAAGKLKEALAQVETAIAKHPDHQDLPGRRGYLLAELGRGTEAEALMADRIARGKATPGEFNNLAWWRVVRGQVDELTLDYARRAILGDGAKSAEAHHTLATVLAESGRTAEALNLFLKALTMRDEDGPIGPDFYLMGRIAEQLGENAAARSYYQRVKDAKGEADHGDLSCQALAQRRLAALKDKQA